jgi:hypothetical protein
MPWPLKLKKSPNGLSTKRQAQAGIDGEAATESQATAIELEAKPEEELAQGNEEEAVATMKSWIRAEQEKPEEERRSGLKKKLQQRPENPCLWGICFM